MSVASPDAGTAEITLKYRILRKAEHGSDNSSPPTANDLHPRGLLAINDEIRQIAEEKTKDTTDAMGKGRAIYNYVLNHMAYDKSGAGWGRWCGQCIAFYPPVTLRFFHLSNLFFLPSNFLFIHDAVTPEYRASTTI